MAACNYNASELGLKWRKKVWKYDPEDTENTANAAS